MDVIKFGPAGADDNFYASGYKHSFQMPEYLHALGLNAFEYQCGRGVNVSQAAAQKLKEQAERYNITLSLHAPYFISLSGVDEEKRMGSINYIRQSMAAAKLMGATRVVIHAGSCAKLEREAALGLAKDTMIKAIEIMDSEGYGDIHMCPELMGVINQLGTLDEIIELCKLDERLIPTIDFGHLNARTFGSLKTQNDFEAVINKIENGLGSYRAKNFHSHFSKIEYSLTSGERKHLTFEDETYGPDFEPLAQVIVKKGLTPTVICESRSTQATDAKSMLEMYKGAIK